ncbi:MAG: hypothetical protein MUC94_11245 [bacterium]|nr:hypothetical protein [bacterium]
MKQLITLIQDHQTRKKCFAIQDAYKLIYQSVFGIEHLLNDLEAAKSYLEREAAAIVAYDAESMLESIALDGAVVRLNLRPYKFRHGNLDRLFQAMLDSAGQINGSQEAFLKWWGYFKQGVIQATLDFNLAELEAFDQKVQSKNYPPMHHSPQYRAANQPAYRVLKREIAEQLLSSQKVKFP